MKDSHKYDKEVREAARCRGAATRKVTEENTHSSVSPGILSLSRWAFMAGLCSFALLWSWYAFTLPACPPSAPPRWQRAKTQPLQSNYNGWFFSPPTKREGVKKGELWLLFWSLHVPPWSCQTTSTVSCRKHGGRTIILIPSPNTRPPAPSQTHAHLCPLTTTISSLLLSRKEQKSTQ